ncbi:DinB family protein [Saccharopolyspora cebuensis]|uniref:DinB family protein n=1 Tax=Saccharopolyspora cebuensis TaxID=418759 RepID=A0ABV4CFZ3_9PSEU
MPPLDADERASLESWLDFYRATLAQKCDGLTDGQLREAAVPPSPLTLLGVVRHMAEVERSWFRRVLAEEDAPPIFAAAGTSAHDGGFEFDADATGEQAVSCWRAEIARAEDNCAARGLDHTSPFHGGQVTLRWIYQHMIGEYARHCGHADLLRERIDGRTGV